MLVSKVVIPDDLRSRVPKRYIELVEGRKPLTLLLFACACLTLWPHKTGWTSFLGAVLGPASDALLFTLFPFHPYHGQIASRWDMENLDKRDPIAMRFEKMFRSSGASKVVLSTTLKLSAALVVAIGAIAILSPKPVEWSFRAEEFFFFTSACAFMCYFIYKLSLLAWAFENWSSPIEE